VCPEETLGKFRCNAHKQPEDNPRGKNISPEIGGKKEQRQRRQDNLSAGSYSEDMAPVK